MALTIAGLKADGETSIGDTGCIRTSFPDFVEVLERLIPGSAEREE
jgi:5-enolpyruvylshikimate-3-phosphate synthase